MKKSQEKYDVIFLFIQNVRDMDIYHEWCKAYFDSICRIKDEIIPSYVDYETYMFAISMVVKRVIIVMKNWIKTLTSMIG